MDTVSPDMSFPWRQRRNTPTDEEIPGLFDVAPLPGGTTTFRIFPGTWNSVTGAAALGYPNILARLLVGGADPNARDEQGRTALMLAVEQNRHEIMTMLVNMEADPNLCDHAGQTPLLWAITLDRQWSVDFLASAGAQTGFAEAVAQGDFALATSLPTNLQLDVPIATQETLLCRTAAKGDFPLTNLLLERGANPNAPSTSGLTPLDAAAEDSRGRIVRLLLDWGADPQLARSNDAATLRQWAGFTAPDW